jgi:hypothetical protein
MKKRVLFVVFVAGIIFVLSSCKGYKHATPCPAYSMEQPANNSVQN